MKPEKEVTNLIWETLESTLQRGAGTFQESAGLQDQMIAGAGWREDPE